MPSSFKRQVAGQPLAQVDNPDPFAVPGLALAGLPDPPRRHLDRAARPAHLAADLVHRSGIRCSLPGARCWSSPVSGSAGRASSPWRRSSSLTLALVYLLWPEWFARHVVQAARDQWRHWFYRRRWQAAMTLAGLAPTYRGRVLVPLLVGVQAAGRWTW